MWISYNLNLLLTSIYTLSGIFTGKNVTSPSQRQITIISDTIKKVAEIRQVVSVYTFSTRDIAAANALSQNQFPDDFLFGVSTFGYQVKGDGKSRPKPFGAQD